VAILMEKAKETRVRMVNGVVGVTTTISLII
jgi:hypothetical protein